MASDNLTTLAQSSSVCGDCTRKCGIRCSSLYAWKGVKGYNKNRGRKSQYRSGRTLFNHDVLRGSFLLRRGVFRPASADCVLIPADAGDKYRMWRPEIAAESAVCCPAFGRRRDSEVSSLFFFLRLRVTIALNECRSVSVDPPSPQNKEPHGVSCNGDHLCARRRRTEKIS